MWYCVRTARRSNGAVIRDPGSVIRKRGNPRPTLKHQGWGTGNSAIFDVRGGLRSAAHLLSGRSGGSPAWSSWSIVPLIDKGRQWLNSLSEPFLTRNDSSD